MSETHRGIDLDILVSATCLIVVVLILTDVGISWIHVFVNIATCGWWRTVVIVCWVVCRVVGRVRRIRKIAVHVTHRLCWRRREVVSFWEVTGIIGMSGRLTWAVLSRAVTSAWAVAALTIGRLVLMSSVSLLFGLLAIAPFRCFVGGQPSNASNRGCLCHRSCLALAAASAATSAVRGRRGTASSSAASATGSASFTIGVDWITTVLYLILTAISTGIARAPWLPS